MDFKSIAYTNSAIPVLYISGVYFKNVQSKNSLTSFSKVGLCDCLDADLYLERIISIFLRNKTSKKRSTILQV